jgi:two-component system, OmpR family, KDP operon response regulator KdpE
MKMLIVAEDHGLIEAISIGLAYQWPEIQVCSAADATTGLQVFLQERPNLVLLDLQLPHSSGWTLLQQIHEVSHTPVVVFIPHGTELNGLHREGADDCLVVAFTHQELLAGVGSALSRILPAAQPEPVFVAGDVTVDFSQNQLRVGGQTVHLSPMEYHLLDVLVRNAGRVLPFDTLRANLWSDAAHGDMDYLKSYIRRLRCKLGDKSDHPQYILTEKGVGYRFVQPSAQAPQHIRP